MRQKIDRFLRRREGFSFNELLVVLFLMGLIVMIATPNVGRWVATSELKSATRTTSAFLKIARVKAVSQNKKFQAIVDQATDPADGATKYRMRLTTKDDNGNTVVTEQTFFKRNISIAVNPTTANPIVYMPNGLVKFPNAELKITVTVIRRAGSPMEQRQALDLYVAGSLKENKIGNL